MSITSVPDAIFVRALGQVCLRYRKERGISQQTFADSVGMDLSNYQYIEHGQNPRGDMSNPQMKTLLAIARGFQVPLNVMMNDAWETATSKL
ncbi:helix-turn-helix domain-containing protein [Flaviflexus massiliensis]|uniref:helix-turn-helix domain-containing protein n=1 Tax=Flaviflexus massiliensis TaxID=1522309 RepID=UPI0006D57261|nr:helix-turn-helix transcriptional regulator [Flaviflexus massiliensis]